ncbi:MAG: LysR family transcriptional regulator [Ruminococcus sp.]|nr:LysR family transcriptional regulator [Ruminococcus sp.]
MNLQHIKYMVEVERVGSVTKAAANMFMGQPNLSKAIKEVETEVGFSVFNRSAKGVFPTDKGELFLEYAKTILAQLDKIEDLRKADSGDVIRFCISVPRASYITHAFTRFVSSLDRSKKMSVDFRETNSMESISNVCDGTSSIAVIRYSVENEEYFMSLLAEKNLRSELLLKFDFRALITADDPLAAGSEIAWEDLENYTEVLHGDYAVPYLSSSYTNKRVSGRRRQIFVYERGSQFDILTEVPNTFMWVSPMPSEILERQHLKQLRCKRAAAKYSDCLIYPASHKFNPYELGFVDHLYEARDKAALSM